MPRHVALCLSLLLAVCLAGCTGVVHEVSPGIVVNITDAFANGVQVGTGTITLHATVANDSSKSGVKWSISQANNGCSPACGTLVASGSPSFTAVYTPPATTPVNQQATIAAVSIADDHQEYAFTFTIIPPPSVTITNKFASIVNGGSPVVVNATVSNDPAGAGVTWTLTAGGSSCSPGCGTLAPAAAPSFAALYTPPATFPAGANANPTITATSVTLTSAADSFSFSINNSASLFKGNYSLLLRGYDGNGLPMSLAGTLTADGNNKITAGEFDIDDYGGVLNVPNPQTGTYTVQLSPTGITQVLFEISSFTFPGSTNDMKFRCFLSADGKRGRIIELDGSGYTNAGTIELQDTTVISAKPSGNFAFGVDSDAPFAGRTVAVGQLILGSAGVTGGLIDQSVDAAPAPIFVAEPITADILTGPDTLGRGTLNITAQGKTVQYAYYIVDSSHFYLTEIDRGLVFGTVFAGLARSQAALTDSSINGVSVIQLTGFDEPTGTSDVRPVVIVGLLTVTGTTNHSYSLTFDINAIGNVLVKHGTNGTITLDPTTGRAQFTSPDGFAASFVNSGALYLYDTGKGFFIEEDLSTPDGTPPDQATTNLALSGTTLPQTGAPFKQSNLSGNVIAGFGASSSPIIPNLELGINLANSANSQTYSAVGDLTSIPTQAANLPNIQFSGTYGLVNATQGYGRMQLPAAIFGDFTSPSGTQVTATFYMIAPNQFVGISIAPTKFSGAFFVDPQ